MLEPVHFHVGNDITTALYSRRELRLGTIVHVARDASGKPASFTSRPSDIATPHSVTWISPSEWSVYLSSGYEPTADLQGYLQATGLDGATIDRAIRSAARKIRLERLFNSDEVERSAINVFTTVSERLKLVELLTGEAMGKRLGLHQEPVIVYLLLTCFDRLGQPAAWLDFGSWIASKDRRAELEQLVAQKGAASPLDACQALYVEYTGRYGVRNAFFRFLREVLPEDARADLLSCIQVGRLRNPPDLTRLPEQEVDKERWLYRLRNDYTHYGRFIRSIPQHDQLAMGITPDIWQMARQQRVDAEIWTDVTLRHWPQVLHETVRRGFAAYVRRVADEVPGVRG